MARKHTNPDKDIAQLIVNQEKKKTTDSSNACVCFYMSLNLLTDDNSEFAVV